MRQYSIVNLKLRSDLEFPELPICLDDSISNLLELNAAVLRSKIMNLESYHRLEQEDNSV